MTTTESVIPLDGTIQTHPEKGITSEGIRQPSAAPRSAGLVKNGIIAMLIGSALIASTVKGLSIYRIGQTHVSTDDAYVTGDLVNISPIVSGTLDSLTVEEGDVVKKGQLIGRLQNSGPLATLQQALAALEAAESRVPEAERNLEFTALTTQAGILHAQSAVASQAAKTDGAQQQVVLSTDTVRNQVLQAQSQVEQAQAQAAQAEAQAAQSDAQVKTAEAGVHSYLQAVRTAQSAAKAAEAEVSSAQAVLDRTSKDEIRYANLLKQEAVTQQQYDSALSAAATAQAQLAGALDRAEQSKSEIERARFNVEQARSQLDATSRQAVAMHKQAEAAQQQVKVAMAGLNLAKASRTQTNIQRSNVTNNVQQGGQAQADLLTAQAGKQQIAMQRKQIDILRAQVQQAKAALANAQVSLDDTDILAPCDGVVVKKAANVGMALSPGQTIVTITQGNRMWVSANFKETQLTHVNPGQKVEIEVDSFPDKVFQGTVESINRATGAATSLLPPDNATGNFTKVVQRIPVKIAFAPAGSGGKNATQKDIEALRQGMSVCATISTAEGGK